MYVTKDFVKYTSKYKMLGIQSHLPLTRCAQMFGFAARNTMSVSPAFGRRSHAHHLHHNMSSSYSVSHEVLRTKNTSMNMRYRLSFGRGSRVDHCCGNERNYYTFLCFYDSSDHHMCSLLCIISYRSTAASWPTGKTVVGRFKFQESP